MDHEGHRKRLRDRFSAAGLEAFAPHEVLELLLTYAIPRRDTKPIAYALITRFGSLHAVLQASVQELMQVDGIGENAATLLSMMMPLFRAYHKSAEEEAPTLKNLQQCLTYCKGLFSGERYEKLYVICLDGRMRRINTVLISSGDVNQVPVFARHVLSAASQCNASGMIITHNHPNGSAHPSSEDIELTEALAQILSGISVTLYDHIIVAPTEIYSFRQERLLEVEQITLENAAQHPERIITIRRGNMRSDTDEGETQCEEIGEFPKW
ncbi:MAG: DNA repair protein RadC [Clostridia bacterium]|nr:DNA repair protein RadC [Clostridia bacterium]